MDSGLVWPRPTAQAVLLESFAVPIDLQKPRNFSTSNDLQYRMVQRFDGENFDEFDESKLHRQNFPYQYFTIIEAHPLVTIVAHARVRTDRE